MHVHGLACRDLVDALAQRVKRNVHKSVDSSACDLGIGSCVKQRHASVAWELFHVVPEELPDLARNDVFSNKSHHIHGIFGRAEGRRIAKLEFCKVGHFRAEPHGGGDHVHTLIHAVKSHDLRTENLVRCLIPQHFDRHHRRPRIIGCVGCGIGVGLIIIVACGSRALFVQTRGGDRHIKELQHRRALRSLVFRGNTADIVRRDAPLLVGRARKWNEGRLARYEILDRYSIAHSVHVGSARLHFLIHNDTAAFVRFNFG